ncbi:hypothetical protein LZ554_000442 [Drepanopeziza brunnea f. sp. 'monogermtubi']|nr:hypothetical protein LZ554_000442 [Drepanopeziza brunnea f. sp. 'monogermtubi']
MPSKKASQTSGVKKRPKRPSKKRAPPVPDPTPPPPPPPPTPPSVRRQPMPTTRCANKGHKNCRTASVNANTAYDNVLAAIARSESSKNLTDLRRLITQQLAFDSNLANSPAPIPNSKGLNSPAPNKRPAVPAPPLPSFANIIAQIQSA